MWAGGLFVFIRNDGFHVRIIPAIEIELNLSQDFQNYLVKPLKL